MGRTAKWPDEAPVFEWTEPQSYYLTNFDLFYGDVVEVIDIKRATLVVKRVGEASTTITWDVLSLGVRYLRPLTPAARDMLALVKR